MQPSLLRQGAEVGEQLVQGLHRRVRREALGVGSEPDDVREHHGDVREGVGDDALALLEPFGDGPRQHVEHHLASVSASAASAPGPSWLAPSPGPRSSVEGGEGAGRQEPFRIPGQRQAASGSAVAATPPWALVLGGGRRLRAGDPDQPGSRTRRGWSHRSYLLPTTSWRTATATSGLSLNSPSTPSL